MKIWLTIFGFCVCLIASAQETILTADGLALLRPIGVSAPSWAPSNNPSGPVIFDYRVTGHYATNGTTAATLADLSGHGYSLTNTTSPFPMISSSVIGGQDGLVFGGNNYLTNSAIFMYGGGGAANYSNTIVMLANLTASGTAYYYCSTNGANVYMNLTSGNVVAYAGTSVTDGSCTNAWKIIAFTAGISGSTIYTNNVAGNPVVASTSGSGVEGSLGGLVVGARYALNLDGKMTLMGLQGFTNMTLTDLTNDFHFWTNYIAAKQQ